MTFDAVLPFAKYLDYYRTLALEEWLVRAVKRSFGRGDDLAQLLSDKRVPELSRELETMRSRNIENETSNRELKAKVKQLETQVAEYKQAVENYENRLRESMRAEASSTSADLSRTKAEVIKSVIESLDGILDGPQGSDLERSLQRLGISRLGKTGSDYVWDTDTCETLLGDAIETGIVVRSGYTWLDGSKKVLIRRVLLKAKIVS
jgi:predicted RNase H-like nuclease (RuvC/YqgF family)